MIIVADKYVAANTAGGHVLNLDFVTESELSQIRDNFNWGLQQSRIGLTGAIARCLVSADDKFAPQYLSKLLRKLRNSQDVASLGSNTILAMAEVADSVGCGHLADELHSLAQKGK